MALLKMVMHARSGGNLEVMGLMVGKIDGKNMRLLCSFCIQADIIAVATW